MTRPKSIRAISVLTFAAALFLPVTGAGVADAGVHPLPGAVLPGTYLPGAVVPGPYPVADAPDLDHPQWRWPLDGPREVTERFRAPAHEYGAGHRGIDATAALGAPVVAPAEGRIAFRGTVVDRPVLTIEHPGGYVSTFEPLSSTLRPGDSVKAGDVIGAVDVGGHALPGTLHLGVRLDGDYIDPLLLFGAAQRAVLLPCCAGT